MDKQIVFFGQKAKVGCDNKCHKAWGRNGRLQLYFHNDASPAFVGYVYDIHDGQIDEDNMAWLPDYLLGIAPADPETYEGGHAKPTDPAEDPAKMNKWCVRECERCNIS